MDFTPQEMDRFSEMIFDDASLLGKSDSFRSAAVARPYYTDNREELIALIKQLRFEALKKQLTEQLPRMLDFQRQWGDPNSGPIGEFLYRGQYEQRRGEQLDALINRFREMQSLK